MWGSASHAGSKKRKFGSAPRNGIHTSGQRSSHGQPSRSLFAQDGAQKNDKAKQQLREKAEAIANKEHLKVSGSPKRKRQPSSLTAHILDTASGLNGISADCPATYLPSQHVQKGHEHRKSQGQEDEVTASKPSGDRAQPSQPLPLAAEANPEAYNASKGYSPRGNPSSPPEELTQPTSATEPSTRTPVSEARHRHFDTGNKDDKRHVPIVEKALSPKETPWLDHESDSSDDSLIEKPAFLASQNKTFPRESKPSQVSRTTDELVTASGRASPDLPKLPTPPRQDATATALASARSYRAFGPQKREDIAGGSMTRKKRKHDTVPDENHDQRMKRASKADGASRYPTVDVRPLTTSQLSVVHHEVSPLAIRSKQAYTSSNAGQEFMIAEDPPEPESTHLEEKTEYRSPSPSSKSKKDRKSASREAASQTPPQLVNVNVSAKVQTRPATSEEIALDRVSELQLREMQREMKRQYDKAHLELFAMPAQHLDMRKTSHDRPLPDDCQVSGPDRGNNVATGDNIPESASRRRSESIGPLVATSPPRPPKTHRQSRATGVRVDRVDRVRSKSAPRASGPAEGRDVDESRMRFSDSRRRSASAAPSGKRASSRREMSEPARSLRRRNTITGTAAADARQIQRRLAEFTQENLSGRANMRVEVAAPLSKEAKALLQADQNEVLSESMFSFADLGTTNDPILISTDKFMFELFKEGGCSSHVQPNHAAHRGDVAKVKHERKKRKVEGDTSTSRHKRPAKSTHGSTDRTTPEAVAPVSNIPSSTLFREAQRKFMHRDGIQVGSHAKSTKRSDKARKSVEPLVLVEASGLEYTHRVCEPSGSSNCECGLIVRVPSLSRRRKRKFTVPDPATQKPGKSKKEFNRKRLRILSKGNFGDGVVRLQESAESVILDGAAYADVPLIAPRVKHDLQSDTVPELGPGLSLEADNEHEAYSSLSDASEERTSVSLPSIVPRGSAPEHALASSADTRQANSSGVFRRFVNSLFGSSSQPRPSQTVDGSVEVDSKSKRHPMANGGSGGTTAGSSSHRRHETDQAAEMKQTQAKRSPGRAGRGTDRALGPSPKSPAMRDEVPPVRDRNREPALMADSEVSEIIDGSLSFLNSW